MTTAALQPGQLIYHHQAVPAAQFRYTDDPALEVVSFPVNPERAVGGQVQIGHRINVYGVRKTVGTNQAAQAELLAKGIPVVDVRAKQGEPANRAITASQLEQSAQVEAGKPLQILTVAVDPEAARQLVELAVDGEYEIWVSLAPLAEPYEEEEKGMTYGK